MDVRGWDVWVSGGEVREGAGVGRRSSSWREVGGVRGGVIGAGGLVGGFGRVAV